MISLLVVLLLFQQPASIRAAGAPCDSQALGQIPTLKGSWETHEDPHYQGYYDAAAACPSWAKDWDCMLDGDVNREELYTAYSKVYKPYECDLRPWNPEQFADCTAAKRIIMIGDSLMRQQWLSLACLLNDVTVSGEHHLWDEEKYPVAMEHDYIARGIPGDFRIPRQYIGRFDLKSGAQVFLRAFGRFNLTLWDDVFAEFQPLTDNDVIVFNFGAWYPRYNVHESGDPWKAWQEDMTELINLRLSRYAARIFYRSATATHFGGVNGTMTFEKSLAAALAEAGRCKQSPLNESWYEDWMKTFLRSCGPRCSKIGILPVFDMTQSRFDAHHGNFGRGKGTWTLDCRHFCTSVTDVWNVVLYNQLC
ncbi:hypothetical protein WJX75_000456 [Coccomyxa subellipsoidea]|uniref:Trichome birefringence-like C-terminal domain-containing protein n=1 Tax=Coccomyxa subellipsoidea TaxID=248742 RepID=A0ABR2YLP6_9CHLO